MPREAPDYSKMSLHKINEAMAKPNYMAGKHMQDTATLALEAIKQGASPKDIIDVKPETIEYFYSQAYRMYNQGKYKEALYLFQMLLMIDPTQPRHALGSAACLHRMGKYEAAGQVYLLTAPLDPKNPLPYFHAADCYIRLTVYELAEFNLNECLRICGEDPKFSLIKDRSHLMLEACKSGIVERDAKAEEEAAAKKAQEKEGASETS